MFVEAMCSCWSGRVPKKKYHQLSCLQRKCAVVGLAEYHKKIYITSGEVDEGLSCCVPKYLLQRKCVKLILTDHYKNLQRQSMTI